jgi:hypothetical protein
MSTEEKQYKAEMALLEVMGEIKKIEKDQYNEFHKYKYAGIEQIYAACRDAMVKAGVILIPRVTDCEIREVRTKKDEPANHAILHIEFVFYMGEMKTTPIQWVGEAMDVSDKAVSKALSFAMKTFLNSLFLIPRVDADPDGGGVEATAGNFRSQARKTIANKQKNDVSKIAYNVLSIFGKGGLDWLKDKNSEEYGKFKHFLVSRCKIYDTYILEYTEEQCKTVLKEFCKIVQLKEIIFPLDTKYIEMFDKYYTELYQLERLELIDSEGDLRDTDGSGKVINSKLQLEAEKEETK